ncbi:pyruvate kinase-like [Anticarsia gemmatalis]|uniref:pyruvate kinase-like n=1 Tax=Anticarsia gemmatalis TaxID=129554 RepID=UPI003F775161
MHECMNYDFTPCKEISDIGEPCLFELYRPNLNRRSRIIVTLANPDVTPVDIQKLMESGMNVVRFLTSTSTTEDKTIMISKVDKAARFLAKKYGMMEWPCATCIELKTCIVKTGIIEQDSNTISIKENTEVILTYDTAEYDRCNERQIFVDNPYLTNDAKEGMEISIKQDEIILKVKEVCAKTVRCVVVLGGNLGNMEIVTMRGARRSRPLLTKKDLELVKLAVEYQVDMLVVNYARHVDTIKKIKKYIGRNVKRPFIVCGISTLEGLVNIEEMIKEADGVLVSREFLAYELERTLANRMGRIQKWILGKCRQVGKPVFISGQVFFETFKSGTLEHQDMPDVANAILDGASGFVLRAHDDIDVLLTVVKGLSDLCKEIEPFANNKIEFHRKLSEIKSPVNAAMGAVMSCALLANETQARLIICPTVSGRTLYYLNWLRPYCMIIAVTTKINTFRTLQIYRGVYPIIYKGLPRRTWYKNIKGRIDVAVEYAVDKNWLVYGDFYITLEKGAEESSFCDTVRIGKVTAKKKEIVTCDDNVSVKTVVNDVEK